MSAPESRRCAIYTRKSSEEGLEQSFNSLDAQREACEAFAKSQAHEGWKVIPDHYDDGGFSGGTMERPALTRLLQDIEDGKIDVIIVYKVDRLSRSLADFVRMIERFDQQNISFVSVTQQFNTSTSMGRLTLNVLLSFAQFEREVTGERIRDKIAASKKKGLWMGGTLPLGYDRVDKQLVVHEDEAEVVRHIYHRYLDLGCVRSLKAELDADGYRSKARPPEGKLGGNKPFSRGALYTILKNPVYVGKVAHKGDLFDGKHAAILEKGIWETVQSRLARNRNEKVNRAEAKHPSLLAGLVLDDKGNRMSPTYTRKGNRHYGYYISQALLQFREADAGSVVRIPATEIEERTTELFTQLLASPARLIDLTRPYEPTAYQLDDMIQNAADLSRKWRQMNVREQIPLMKKFVAKVEVSRSELRVTLAIDPLLKHLSDDSVRCKADSKSTNVVLKAAVHLKRSGIEKKLTFEEGETTLHICSKTALQRSLLKALRWNEALLSGQVSSIEQLAEQEGLSESYIRKERHLPFLSIDTLERIAGNDALPQATLDRIRRKVDLDWQRQALS